MGRVLVCNTSPIIALARIGKLQLLAALGSRILVPNAVLRELEAGSERDQAAEVLRAQAGFEVVSDVQAPEALRAWQLDPGETQVLAVALDRGHGDVVLDDLAARRCAKTLGLVPIGTLGVIALAKQRGLIPAAREIVEAMVAQGLRIHPTLLQSMLAAFGESADEP